jgi:hypothetical protein
MLEQIMKTASRIELRSSDFCGFFKNIVTGIYNEKGA